MPSDLVDFINKIIFLAEQEQEEDVTGEIECCLQSIRSLAIKRELERIASDLKKAESEKDKKRIESLTKSFKELAQRLNTIKQ